MKKKEDLYIIGNGFDLWVGLKTSYKDYFEHRKYDEKRKELLNFFSKSISKEELEQMVKKYENENLFLLYLISMKDKEIEEINWNDVERRIFSYIIEFEYILENLNKKNKENNESKSKIEKTFIEMLLKSKRKKKIDLFLELNEFEKDFGNYINEQNKKYTRNGDIISKGENIIKDLEKNEELGKSFKSKNIRNVLNFNYTNYSSFYAHYNTKMINIHNNYKKPIFGIDVSGDEIFCVFVEKKKLENYIKNKNNININKFTKTSRVLFETTEREIDILPDFKNLESIYFFGHSLSKADYSYFQTIFDYYNIYDSDKELVFLYVDYKSKEDEVKNEQKEAIFNLMNEYGKTFDNQKKGKNLLHKLLLEGRIKLREVKKRNI